MKDEGLFDGSVVSPESSLGGSVKVLTRGNLGETLVHNRHEKLSERGGNSNAAVVIRVSRVAHPLIQGCDL